MSVHRQSGGDPLLAVDPATITALNEIARLTPEPDGVEAVTTPDSGDSQLRIPVATPIDTGPTALQQLSRFVGIDVSMTLLVLLAAGLVYWLGPSLWPRLRPLTAPVRTLDRRFAAWAATLSRPDIMAVDRWVFWFYTACALVFGGLAAGGFHGSSLDEYSSQYPWSGVAAAPIEGRPEGIRSDEWALHTPAFLNQLYRRQQMEVGQSTVGGQNAALLVSLPCRGLYPVGPPGLLGVPRPAAPGPRSRCTGNARASSCSRACFSLLLLLTRGRPGLAALGALWMFFSAHMQWAYSWMSLLPEMVGFFGWTICLTLYLCVGRNRWLLTAAAVGCAVSAVDFALCFYPAAPDSLRPPSGR